MDVWVFLVLGAGSLVGTALIILAMRKAAERQHDYQAFADAKGWQLDIEAPTHTSAGHTRFSETGDDWTLDIIVSGGQGGSLKRRVEWRSPQGALAEGIAVLGAPLPEKAAAITATDSAMGKAVLKAGLKHTLAALGNTARTLVIDEASAGDPGGVVMSSDGNAHAMDTIRQVAELRAARIGRNEAQQPIVIRDTNGLSLRRMGQVQTLDDLSDLVALGKSVRAAL